MLSDLGMFSNIKKRIIKTSQEDDTENNGNNSGIIPPTNSSNNTSQENTEENTETNGNNQTDSDGQQTPPRSDNNVSLINFDVIDCAAFNRPFVAGEVLVVTSIPHPNRKTDESDNTPRHNGIDFRVSSGTNINPIYNGTVDKVDLDSGYGNYVDIKHNINSQEIITRYAHLSDTLQAETIMNSKKAVTNSSVIGKSGSTGTSTGAHLHLEIFKSDSKPNWEDSFTLLKCLITANKVEITDPNVQNEYNELEKWIANRKQGDPPRAGEFYRNNNSGSQ